MSLHICMTYITVCNVQNTRCEFKGEWRWDKNNVGTPKQLHNVSVCLWSMPSGLLKSKASMQPTHTLNAEHFGCYICKVLQFWGFWCLCQHNIERSEMAETAERCGCDKMCGVDCIVKGQIKGNEVVKPYKIITKGEVVSSVVTGSLHDNFLLLENKGVTALHWNILCVWCRDRLGYTYSQGSNVTLCGRSVLRFKTIHIFLQKKN